MAALAIISLVILVLALTLKSHQGSPAAYSIQTDPSVPSFLFSLLQSQAILLARLARACSIFCDGDLLQAVQTRALFEDDKTFVDLELRAE